MSEKINENLITTVLSFITGYILSKPLRNIIIQFLGTNYPVSTIQLILILIFSLLVIFSVCVWDRELTIYFRIIFLGIAFQSSISGIIAIADFIDYGAWTPQVFGNMYSSIFFSGLFTLFERLIVISEKIVHV